MCRRVALALAVAVIAAACSGSDGSSGAGRDETATTSSALPDYTSEVYADPAHWLCRPDLDDDACATDLDATAVRADGTLEVEPFTPAADPPIDCFYVYPTVSSDPGANSDLVPDDPEVDTVRIQAARFARECAVYAPVYRQGTVRALFSDDPDLQPDFALAYADVLDAWKHYLANDNHGRGVVLIGHSQGAAMLARLIAEEIDPDPARRAQLVSALLIGTAISVPEGGDVGGDFADVPACRASDQTGCVVSYASFRSTAPPPPDSRFGRPRDGEGVALCTNPAALDGGPAELTPYFPSSVDVLSDPDAVPEITTPWVTFPGLLRAECVERDGFSYLEVTVQADPADPRVDDIDGDLTPPWGLHLVDVHLALGDLVDLVGAQAGAYETG